MKREVRVIVWSRKGKHMLCVSRKHLVEGWLWWLRWEAGSSRTCLWSRQEEESLVEAGLWDRRPCCWWIQRYCRGGGQPGAETAAWSEQGGRAVRDSFWKKLVLWKNPSIWKLLSPSSVWNWTWGQRQRCLFQTWQLWGEAGAATVNKSRKSIIGNNGQREESTVFAFKWVP